ncbi:hypothetical protein BJX99DRAFT_258752 [Aspergillus californicus]
MCKYIYNTWTTCKHAATVTVEWCYPLYTSRRFAIPLTEHKIEESSTHCFQASPDAYCVDCRVELQEIREFRNGPSAMDIEDEADSDSETDSEAEAEAGESGSGSDLGSTDSPQCFPDYSFSKFVDDLERQLQMDRPGQSEQLTVDHFVLTDDPDYEYQSQTPVQVQSETFVPQDRTDPSYLGEAPLYGTQDIPPQLEFDFYANAWAAENAFKTAANSARWRQLAPAPVRS